MSGTLSKMLPLGVVTYLINHIFLPPKLPQEDDLSFEYESAMLDTVIDCLSKFKGHIGGYNIDAAAAAAMMFNLRDVRDNHSISGAVNEKKLRETLGSLYEQGKAMGLLDALAFRRIKLTRPKVGRFPFTFERKTAVF